MAAGRDHKSVNNSFISTLIVANKKSGTYMVGMFYFDCTTEFSQVPFDFSLLLKLLFVSAALKFSGALKRYV